MPLDIEVESPDNPADAITARLTFDQLMERLRPEERAAVVLHYRHELTHPEITTALGLPLGTVKSLLRRARLKLQALHPPDR